MLEHVLDTARLLDGSRLCVVVGHEAEQVKSSISEDDVVFVEQVPQLGTGHAVQLTVPFLDERAPTLILYGDVPLIQEDTLKRLLSKADNQNLALLTVHLSDPTGYGRIVRDAQGNVSKIVEQKDAHPEQLAISEINTGILIAPTAPLKKWLAQLSNHNAQGGVLFNRCHCFGCSRWFWHCDRTS